MTIESRIKRLEHIDEFATKPVRGIMYVCDELPADTYTLSVGDHIELIKRHEGETNEAFDRRAHAAMEGFYSGDKNTPVAFLHPLEPEANVENHVTQ